MTQGYIKKNQNKWIVTYRENLSGIQTEYTFYFYENARAKLLDLRTITYSNDFTGAENGFLGGFGHLT